MMPRPIASWGWLLLVPLVMSAQPVLEVGQDCEAVAPFVDAWALAADPAGRFYIADKGTDAVVVLAPDGTVLAAFGSAGVGETAFDGPAGVDPTNGLVLYVADEGNGRIARFTNDLRLLGALAVPAEPGAALARAQRGEPAPIQVRGDGRPIAVAAAPTGEVWAIEAASRSLLRWDAYGRLAQVAGGYGEGAGALIEPVAMVYRAREGLLVADAGRRELLAFDLLGTYAGVWAADLDPAMQAVRVGRNRLWVVAPEAIHLLTLEGEAARTLRWTGPSPLRDVSVEPHASFFALTPEALLRCPWPE